MTLNSHSGRTIVLPVHHFPPRFTAGGETYTYGLARSLQAHGWNVEVVALEAIDRGSTQTIDARYDPHDGIPVWRLTYDHIRSPDRIRWNFDNALLGEWFRDYFARVQPDLVHFQAGYLIGVAPVFAAKAAGIPTILTLHDYWYICPQHTLLRGDGSLCHQVPDDPRICVWCRRMKNPIPRLATQVNSAVTNVLGPRFSSAEATGLMQERRERTAKAMAQVDRVIAVSEFVGSMIRSTIDVPQMEVCRLGIRDERFEVTRPPADPTTLRIGFLGQVAEHKGVHHLIEAFHQLHISAVRPTLEIYGGPLTGDYAADLRHLAGNHPHIVFHGSVQNAHVPRTLAGLDLLVVPSVWFENSPLVVLEALSVGTPVVVSDLGGLKEMVDHGRNGLRVAARDSAQLAAALQMLLDGRAQLMALQAGARATHIRTKAEEMEQLLSIYEAVLTRVHAPAAPPKSHSPQPRVG